MSQKLWHSLVVWIAKPVDAAFLRLVVGSNSLIFALFACLFLLSRCFSLSGWSSEAFLPVAWLITALSPPLYLAQQKIDPLRQFKLFFCILITNFCSLILCMILWDFAIR